jgi:putative membrane protein
MKPQLDGSRLGHWIVRTAFIWALQTLALLILSQLIPGVRVDSWQSAVVLIGVIALLNAILWPILSYITIPLAVLSLGLFTLALNSGILWLAFRLIPGVSVTHFWTYPALVLGLTAFGTLFSSLFTLDDESSYYRNIVLREAGRRA